MQSIEMTANLSMNGGVVRRFVAVKKRKKSNFGGQNWKSQNEIGTFIRGIEGIR